jgi:hypothetical protein
MGTDGQIRLLQEEISTEGFMTRKSVLCKHPCLAGAENG